jgi:nucleoside triphosphate pyrophosphatase
MILPNGNDDSREVLILASGSPRRLELLNQMGVRCEVIAPHLNEEEFEEKDPERLVRALAGAKAQAVRDIAPRAAQRWILAADTVVVVAAEVLGKPSDRAHAATMITKLSGRTHAVVTGIAVWPPAAERPAIGVAETTVSFAELTSREIESYLDTNQWKDVAGGYRIQGRAALYIDSISGSYSNVVGLPIHLVYSIFTQHGYQGLG